MLLETLIMAGLAAQPPREIEEKIYMICSETKGLAGAETIGQSVGGRPILAVTVAASSDVPKESRPGVLILAGTHGQHHLGTDLAVNQLECLVDGWMTGDEATRKLLKSHVVWIVPMANPDGRAMNRIGNARGIDLDRDRARDEDRPVDLNGDGVISWMRWADPDGEWVVDDEDPRLMRKAEDGERGTHSMAIEAKDHDGDGERGEDDAQGIHIHRNFSHRHEEFDRRTGPFPMSEPETRAVADFIHSHRNLVMAFVWGPDDNLLATPKTGKPKARTQLDGILDGDKSIYESAGELYRELTGREGESNPRHDGSAWSYLNFQVGVPTFASDVWRLPDDEKLRADATGAFRPWRKHMHPDLGDVEIGGFVEGRAAISDEERKKAFETHHAFFLQAVHHGPAIRVRDLTKKKLGANAWRIEATLSNEGDWPMLTATGERSRRFGAPRAKLVLDGAELLVGDLRHTVRNLEADGGTQKFSWIVLGEPGATIRFEVVAFPIGGHHMEVKL